MSFTAFSPDALAFLQALSENNSREWFSQHKQAYEDLVREPALAFIRAMEGPIKQISPHFTAVAKKSGGSLMRVYRDVRFSPDKRPLKTNVGIQFRHERGKDVHAPGFYFHFDTEECFVGIGMWHPDSDALKKIRLAVRDRWDEYRSIREDREFSQTFTSAGERLKRPPKGFDAEHPGIEELKKKDFIDSCNFEEELLFSEDLVEKISDYFRRASKFQGFLCSALNLPY